MLTLGLTGPGSFASFTSSDTVNNSFATGSFQLEAFPSGPPTVSGPLIWAAQPAAQPVQSLTTTTPLPTPVTTGAGNALTYNLANANPGDAYTYQFTVGDVGTLQGQVNTISYQADSATNAQALENQMTVEVQEQVNGTWTDIHNSSDSGASGVAQPASGNYTYYLDYSFGPAFLQPNTFLDGVPQCSAGACEESTATFRVVFTFLNPTTNPNSSNNNNVVSQNAVEGFSASPTITVNGTNTP
ncbi:MAG: SipW-dependent-type signal peptide-containing protein [Acidimicrobiales bacterium]